MADYKFNKHFEQRRLTDFWYEVWPIWKVAQWDEIIKSENNTWANFEREYHIDLVKDALKKMTLEKVITEDTLYNMLAMADSPDQENVYMVLSVMQKLKKTKFKRNG